MNTSSFTVRAVRSLPFQCVALASAAALGVAVSGSRSGAAQTSADSRLKIATVDMQQLFKEYYKTNQAQAVINAERVKIQNEAKERETRLNELQTSLETMKKQLSDPSIADAKKQSTYQEFQMKQQEGAALDRDRREFMETKNKALNESMVLKMKAILDEIQKATGEEAKSADYDYVFDKSGMSTSQVPFLLYTKDAVDMTPELSKRLNKDAPPAKEAAPADKDATPPAKEPAPATGKPGH
jgi:Skp family chaperone for outer membrane proteins